MTEYTDVVEKRRLELEAKQWGKGIKYIHYNNSVETTAYQNGDKKHINIDSGKVIWEYDKDSKLTLIEKYRRWQSDRYNEDGFFQLWRD